jgi:hypothetical protein
MNRLLATCKDNIRVGYGHSSRSGMHASFVCLNLQQPAYVYERHHVSDPLLC